MRRNRLNSKVLVDALDKSKIAERVCAICGAELEIDPESGELRCPVCEESGAP